jgi:mycoredoxin
VAYEWIDIDDSAEGDALVRQLNRGFRSVPTLIFGDGTTLVEPSDRELTSHLEQRGL